MRLDQEKGINFRQAQGVEKQCPMVGFIETVEDLIGTTAESMSGHERDKDYFCHRKIEFPKYSEGHPQLLIRAVLTPESACKTTFKELLRQLEKMNGADTNTANEEERNILDRWTEVVSQNNHQETYDFGTLATTKNLRNSEVIKKVNAFVNKFFKTSLKGCKNAPNGDVFENPMEPY